MSNTARLTGALVAALTFALGACQLDSASGPSALGSDPLLAKGGIPGPPGGKGEDEGLGNNLSYPVILAEGRGLGGASVLNTDGTVNYANTGFRPTTTETAAFADIVAGTLPFWYSGNVATPYLSGFDVFWQKTANTWQAEWIARDVTTPTSVIVDWGDNLKSSPLTTTSVIRVEHVLNANDGTLLQGFTMDITVNPSSPTEEQGIYDDGGQSQTVAFTPTVFTDRARLTLQKLDGPAGNVVYTAFDKAVYESLGIDGPGGYAAEINVGGKVIFGYVWNMKQVVMPGGIAKDGWWRITFSVDAGSGVTFAGVGTGDEAIATLVNSTTTTAEVQITTTRGGGGRKGGGGSGGGGGPGGPGGPGGSGGPGE